MEHSISETSDEEIEEQLKVLKDSRRHTSRGNRLCLKALVFCAITILSAFVICVTHFPHLFCINHDLDDYSPINYINSMINKTEDKEQNLTTFSHQVIKNQSALHNDQSHLKKAPVVNDEFRPLIDEQLFLKMGEMYGRIETDWKDIKSQISSANRNDENIEQQLTKLFVKMDEVDFEILDMKDQISIMRSKVDKIFELLTLNSETTKKSKKKSI